MPTIQSSGYPLVFQPAGGPSVPAPEGNECVRLRTYVRALEGMQKEALVLMGTPRSQQRWRMVSDEGPYLNGTDLAPFPLAFFMAGMQFSLLSEVLRQADAQDVEVKTLSLVQDNYYTMEGSALQGTMLGGARPSELSLKIRADASDEEVALLAQNAFQRCAGQALMRDIMTNEFALTCNGEGLSLEDICECEMVDEDVEALFEKLEPDEEAGIRPDIITRISQAKELFGVEGGAASSLQAEQKRTLHVHGEARWLEQRLLETTVQLYRPIGSTFRFLCDGVAEDGGQESAPPALAYLAAGIGFCFMTQIGRYAHITKQPLQSYRIIQDNAFHDAGEAMRAMPVQTHVYLGLDAGDESAAQMAQKTVWMSERTCFLHAAMRGTYPSVLRFKGAEDQISVSE